LAPSTMRMSKSWYTSMLAIMANEMPRVLDPFRFVLFAVAGG